jgi:hypothetical protein
MFNAESHHTYTLTEQQGVAMETDEQRAMFIANEIGAAVIDLIANGMDVNRAKITDYLELKRKTVGNTLYKGVLRNAAALVREKK